MYKLLLLKIKLYRFLTRDVSSGQEHVLLLAYLYVQCVSCKKEKTCLFLDSESKMSILIGRKSLALVLCLMPRMLFFVMNVLLKELGMPLSRNSFSCYCFI
jgi:hypothetical protein